MATLSVTFGKELSPQITDIYWEAHKPLAIEQFEESAKSSIRHSKHFPKPAELLERWAELQQSAPKPFTPLPRADAKWLGLVNGMFLRYLLKRRIDEGFKGDIDVAARRSECLTLAALFETAESEGDSLAIEAHLRERFDNAMKRVRDKSPEPDWLAIQIEYQRTQNADRARA